MYAFDQPSARSAYLGQPSRSAVTSCAFDLACGRVEQAMRAGKLMTPAEAHALAGPEARSKETLFSIARTVAWETDSDQDMLLRQLACRYPRFDRTGRRSRPLMSDE